MAFERERHVGGGHTAPIVLDLDPRNPALGDSHRNASRTGVDGVFNQFLERGGGSFNHFARCDPIYELFRQATRSEEHTSELQSLMRISYAVFCLKKKNKQNTIRNQIYDHPHTTIH